MKKKIRILTILALCFILVLQGYPVVAKSSRQVQVHYPGFKVTLNGFPASPNDYYPVIVYRDITYVPLTQDVAELLNLRVFWDNDTRHLSITGNPIKSKILSGFGGDSTPISGKMVAEVVGYTVSVNGHTLDLAKEAYPILNFRNITYFPLTWRFAAQEFKWQYHFDMTNGLSIRSINYDSKLVPDTKIYDPTVKPIHNNLKALPKLKPAKSLSIPLSAFKEPFYYQNGNLFYFVNHNRSIDFWRQSLNGKAQKIGSADIAEKPNTDGFHFTRVFPSSLLFTSHFGGAIMGSDNHYLLPSTGNASLFSTQRFQSLLATEQGFIGTLFDVTGPQTGMVKVDSQGNLTKWGNSAQYYFPYQVQGNHLYAKVSSTPNGEVAPLYRINLTSGEQQLLLPEVQHLSIDGNTACYTGYNKNTNDRTLYRYDIANGREYTLASTLSPDGQFLIRNGMIYETVYRNGEENRQNLYRLVERNWQLLAGSIKKPLFSDSHLVYATKSEIVVANAQGNAIAVIPMNNLETDYFLNGSELIVWSWQTSMVHYYTLPR